MSKIKVRQFSVAICNIGPGISASETHDLTKESSVIFWNEASDQEKVFKFVRQLDWRTIRPPGPGSATPLSYDPDVWQFGKPIDELLLARRAPSGKDGGKEKRLIGGSFIHKDTRRHIRFGSWHSIVSHQFPHNEADARKMCTRVDNHLNKKVVGMFGADMNHDANESCTFPLRDHGWNCDQLADVPYNDRMDRIIQCWWTKDKRISYISHKRLITNPNDHNANIVTFRWTDHG